MFVVSSLSLEFFRCEITVVFEILSITDVSQAVFPRETQNKTSLSLRVKLFFVDISEILILSSQKKTNAAIIAWSEFHQANGRGHGRMYLVGRW
ncbi:hypothetical protein YH62_16680 [Rhizobium sp. LC145]|nr:hypothetical protein YH62_16680 [Rhizobium sp. LC145]